MKKLLIAAIMFFSISMASSAQNNFNLNSISADQIGLAYEEITVDEVPLPDSAYSYVPQVKSPFVSPALDLSVKLPFAMINQRIAEVKGLEILDSSQAILKREGDHLVFGNILVTVNGVMVEPTILIKPWFESENKLAIKFVKVDVDIVLGPKSAFPLIIDKDGVMSYIIDLLTNAIAQKMDEALSINEVPLKAEDILVFSYDKKSWTLKAGVSPEFIAPLLPGLIDNVYLTAFSFNDEGFIMSVNSGAAKIREYKGYNLAFSDGLITKFIRKYTKGTDLDLSSKVKDGGIQFRLDGRMKIVGKMEMESLPFNPDVYFTAKIKPTVTAPNTIRLTIEKMEVDKVYGMGFLGSIVNIMEGKIIKTTIENIAGNPKLAKVVSARKIDKRTVELKLKNSAFLPSFAKGVVINKLLLKHGLLYLDFAF